jgi:beta-lactamase superfamily II metal-dependent hydrolase
MRPTANTLCALTLVSALAVTLRGASTLDIYFIDVDGGQSTLLVTPSHQSFLIDTGYAGNGGRDADRIVAAARTAGLTKIDYLMITHFHGDHAGGVVDLAKRLPIAAFIDHDTILPTDANSKPTFDAYATVRGGGRHIIAKPGDRLPIEGMDVRVVSSGGVTISAALSGAAQPNPACPPSAPDPGEPSENPRSTGVVVQFGQFRFIDLGDLSGKPLYALFCPANLLGQASVYLVPHHGGNDVVYPATFAVKPRVAIMNNGERKGGSPESFAALHAVPGIRDVWQLHKSRADAARNYADANVANLDETTGHWIKVSAEDSGAFSVTNGRTQETRKY